MKIALRLVFVRFWLFVVLKIARYWCLAPEVGEFSQFLRYLPNLSNIWGYFHNFPFLYISVACIACRSFPNVCWTLVPDLVLKSHQYYITALVVLNCESQLTCKYVPTLQLYFICYYPWTSSKAMRSVRHGFESSQVEFGINSDSTSWVWVQLDLDSRAMSGAYDICIPKWCRSSSNGHWGSFIVLI